MPIIPKIETRRLSQDEFGAVAYDVMNHVFAIHNEMGRFFDEKIYQRELFSRLPDVILEAQIDVVYESFKKQYFADVIVGDGGLFECKAAESIHSQHENQAIHYLLLFDLAHGKVINVRPEQVESKFVNCRQRLADLRNPNIDTTSFLAGNVRSKAFRDILTNIIRDWGTGLDLRLYENAVVHFLGGESRVCQKTAVFGSKGEVGQQALNYIDDAEIFWLTSFPEPDKKFEINARKLIKHTSVNIIQWANINNETLTFTTLSSR